MILEGIVTTLNSKGEVNIAPMGPHVDAEIFDRFVLRPFPTSQTYRNLKEHGMGVLHVTDDVLLLAKAAVGKVEPLPEMFDAEAITGKVLAEACRYFEFLVTRTDESDTRMRIEAEVVREVRLRDFFGFNRAKYAVVEAAILATRVAFLSREEIETEFRKLAVLIEKTAGEQERAAFEFLKSYVLSPGEPGA